MDFFDVVHTQRSIRRFKPDPVPPEAIRKMIDAAIRAPSGSNSQPWIWLVVRDQAKREAIAVAVRQHFGGTGSIENLRRNAEQLEDPGRRRMMLGAAGFFENVAAAPVLIIPCLVGITSPVTDGGSLLAGSSIYGAVQNMMLAARAQGLGRCSPPLTPSWRTLCVPNSTYPTRRYPPASCPWAIPMDNVSAPRTASPRGGYLLG